MAPTFPSQMIPCPLPELDKEGVPLYEVEKILTSQKIGQGTQYLVKWKGYPESENTWEPE
jgi:Chromo (CHRromatin Organisation MOdifier) domain